MTAGAGLRVLTALAEGLGADSITLIQSSTPDTVGAVPSSGLHRHLDIWYTYIHSKLTHIQHKAKYNKSF